MMEKYQCDHLLRAAHHVPLHDQGGPGRVRPLLPAALPPPPGEALNPEVYNQWLDARPACKICEGFGQTETTLCSLATFPWMQPRPGSMGKPAPAV